MSNKVLNIINDEPLTDLDQDSYRYKDLAQEIARCISAVDALTSSFTISLNGLWGSGKTSLINLKFVLMKSAKGTSTSPLSLDLIPGALSLRNSF